MKHSYSFSLILLPLFLLLILAATLFVQRTGITYKVSSKYYQAQQFLPDEVVDVKNYFPDKSVDALVLFDSENIAKDKDVKILVDDVYAVLDTMRVKYDTYDVNSAEQIDLSKYKTVVFTVLDISKIDSQINLIMTWMENGGNVLFAIRPDGTGTFKSIARKLGIVNSGDLVPAKGVEFQTDVFVGAKGKSIGLDFLNGTSYPVELEQDCVVHLVSKAPNKIPLLWQCDVGNGHIVFINSDQFGDRAARGVLSVAYSLLEDTFVYPVINSSVFYIDDFPAPFPEGRNDYITQYYDMDSFSFYRDVWWPEMQKIAEKYDLRFTGGMIETYTENVTPPLDKGLDIETHKYFGRSLLASGGEIIFHGHNHIPLCTVDNDINSRNGYISWPDTEAAQLSLSAVYTFGNSVFPDYHFLGYIPPSNVLCSDSRRWLPLVVPDLKYIASVYLPDELSAKYDQEFTEASDGIIEFPRVISGYDIPDDEYMQWAAINALSLYYVNTHFTHPDDLLDPDRGADKGWPTLRDEYVSYLQWLQDSTPGLREMTGSEGAMAVQRFSRLAVNMQNSNGKLEISLGNFYDEAWLMLHSTKKPLSIDGGTITQVSSEFYLVQASVSKVVITFQE